MNYVSVVSVGLVSFVVVLWLTSKKGVFMGPKIDMAELQERRMAAMRDDGIVVVEATEGASARAVPKAPSREAKR